MITDMPHRVAKRSDYPSGKWPPDTELSQAFRGRLIYLLRQRQMRFWSFCAVGCLLGALLSVLLPQSGSLFLLIGPVVIGLAIYALVQSGRPVEGLIVSVTDDGIDKVYAVYYEDGTDPYEVSFVGKRKTHAGQLRQGDSLTLVVARPPGLLPQVLILRPL
jgi:hypothetical protein